MDPGAQRAIAQELAGAFGEAKDVTPAEGQPLHVLLPAVTLPSPWGPSPSRVLVRFSGWPASRPDFFIDGSVKNVAGQPPRSSSTHLVLGEPWLQFSFSFPWPPAGSSTAVRAVQLWLTRFREQT